MSSTPKQPVADHSSTSAASPVIPLDWSKGLRQNLSADLPAGFVAFLLALPLSLGIAQASGFPASMGIVTAVIGGLVATFLAGSRLTIKGPAAGLIVIIAGCVAEFGGGVEGWHLALGVMVVAGLVQIAFGLLKWGRLVNFFPLAAVHGMLAAIGLIIIAKQVPVLLNVEPALAKGKGPIELLASIPAFVANLNPGVAVIGVTSLVIMFGWPMIARGFLKKVPAPLIVLLVAVPASLYLDLANTGSDYTLVKVGRLLDQVGINVSMGGLSHLGIFVKYVFMVAVVGTLESLLTVKAIDALDPYHRKSDPNKDLIAVGVANTVAAVLGGLPMISEVARSSANVASGAKTRWANFFHGIFLLVAALAAYQVLEMIPNAALAAMLIAVGVKLAHPKEFIHTYQIGPEQLAIFITTVFFTLFEDLLIGIAAGIALKVIIHLMRGAPLKELFRSSVTMKEDGDRIVLSLGKVASFTNYLALDEKLESLPAGKKIEIDIAETVLLDHSVQENLEHFASAYRSNGGEVMFTALEALQPISNHPLAARRRVKTIAVTADGELVTLAQEVDQTGFDESRLMHRLHHYLPAQLALKDFVHHNTLHGFQDKEFFEGIFSASRILGYQVTLSLHEYRQLFGIGRIRAEVLDRVITDQYGTALLPEMRRRALEGKYDYPQHARVGSLRQNWKTFQQFGMDDCIQPRLFRLLVAFLDQGVAEVEFPFVEQGLLPAIRRIEEASYVSMLRSKRARRLLKDEAITISDLLQLLVGDPAYYEQYVLDQQFAHRGWSGLVSAIEGKPDTLFYRKEISLKELIQLELILEIDALDDRFGVSWQPLCAHPIAAPQDYFASIELSEIEQVLQVWQEAFEWDYYDQVLSAVGHLAAKPKTPETDRASFQAVFCIDDRECSIRRHIETVDASARTFGAPGHFGLNVLYRPEGGKFLEKNCPVPAIPSHVLRERERPASLKGSSVHLKRNKPVTTTALQEIWLSLVAAFRLPSDLLFPTQRADAASSFSHMHPKGELEIEFKGEHVEGLPVGYTVPEMAERVRALIESMGAKPMELAKTVYIIGHGSSSANNPHYAAYDCGACSGRPGSVNARAFAYMANHREVRTLLETAGFQIPKDTSFVGGLHDTASDVIEYYDVDKLSNIGLTLHIKNAKLIEKTLERNARERARRFASISQTSSDLQIRQAIKDRTVKYFETRPELNHGSNALCYVGDRNTIRGLFLDRRAFLSSYNPNRDPDGSLLSTVLAPLPTVCGGINLEYYFSRMDNEKLGAGTKLPHQIMGLIGVANSSDGDLRPGLHWQTVENHDPIRLLMIIEQTPEIIERVINATPANKAWFTEGWIHLVSIHPQTGKVMRYRDQGFEPYQAFSEVLHTEDIDEVIRKAPKMATAHIVDATTENLPVHIYTTKR